MYSSTSSSLIIVFIKTLIKQKNIIITNFNRGLNLLFDFL